MAVLGSFSNPHRGSKYGKAEDREIPIRPNFSRFLTSRPFPNALSILLCRALPFRNWRKRGMNGYPRSRFANSAIRILEFCSATAVVGMIGRVFHCIREDNGPTDWRLVYAQVVAASSSIASLTLMPPLHYAFKLWPADLAL